MPETARIMLNWPDVVLRISWEEVEYGRKDL